MPQIHAIEVVTAAAAAVFTSAEAKAHLRIDGTQFDALVPGWIAAATRAAQSELRRQLIDATFDMHLDGFPACIEVPLGASSITSIKYYDDANVLQTLDPARYVADVVRKPGRIHCAYGTTWPTVYPRANAVQVRFVAGYGATSAAVPDDVKHWMLLQIGSMRKNAEAEITGVSVSEIPNRFVERLLDGERLTVV